MIKVKFKEEDGFIKMEAKGHADARISGAVLICANQTALSYCLAQCVLDMQSEGKLEGEPRIKIKEGFSEVFCKPKKEYYEEARHCYFVVQTGLEVLGENYPKALRIQRLI